MPRPRERGWGSDALTVAAAAQRDTPERRATARAAAAAAAAAECTFRPATNEAASRQLLARIVGGRGESSAADADPDDGPDPDARAGAALAALREGRTARAGAAQERMGAAAEHGGDSLAEPHASEADGAVESTTAHT
jgi:hypothetical protein